MVQGFLRLCYRLLKGRQEAIRASDDSLEEMAMQKDSSGNMMNCIYKNLKKGVPYGALSNMKLPRNQCMKLHSPSLLDIALDDLA
jgi:hypothetical protein